MRQEICEACGQSYPLNKLYQVFGATHCEPCGNSALAARQGKPQPGDVTRMVDPTVCGWCAADYGREELPPIAGVPACQTCTDRMRNWPFPAWVKLSFAALLIVALGAFFYNLRFFRAYMHVLQARHAASFEEARDRAAAAAELVPESVSLQHQADIFRAIDLVREDKPAEALPLLQKLSRRAPQDPIVSLFLVQAEMGVAFDQYDYDTFLAKARELADRDPRNAMSRGTLASALACKYAATRDEKYKREAAEALTAAKGMPGADTPEFAAYEDRIQFRLATREIIKTDEFMRRFPQGWHGAQEQP